ncbi:hypothetical protein ANCCEY_03303, partial [Ancylostoma ceylanicum]
MTIPLGNPTLYPLWHRHWLFHSTAGIFQEAQRIVHTVPVYKPHVHNWYNKSYSVARFKADDFANRFAYSAYEWRKPQDHAFNRHFMYDQGV